MYVAEVRPGLWGQEEKIRQEWEESGHKGTIIEFDGNVARICPPGEGHLAAWEEDRVRRGFQAVVHRVLPGCEVVWKGRKGQGAIRIVADSSSAGVTGGEIPTLESLGFTVKRMSGTSGGIMHNKYTIIDRKLLLTGSYNWSARAEDNNFENAVFVIGTPVIQSFAADFSRLWAR